MECEFFRKTRVVDGCHANATSGVLTLSGMALRSLDIQARQYVLLAVLRSIHELIRRRKVSLCCRPDTKSLCSGYLSPSLGLKFSDVPNGLAALSKRFGFFFWCVGFPRQALLAVFFVSL